MSSLQDEIQVMKQDMSIVKSDFGYLKSELKCVQEKKSPGRRSNFNRQNNWKMSGHYRKYAVRC